MDQKGKAMSVVMTVAALGTALGPTIGGFLTQYLSWHAIFFINVPVGIVAIILGAKVVPAAVRKGTLSGFDTAGAGLAFAGLASLLFVVSEGETLGWTSPVIVCLALLAVFTLGWFAWHELRAPDPLLDLHLFRNRNFLFANLLLALVFFSFAGINYLLPFFLEYVRGYDVSSAGLVLSALSFAMMGAGLLAGMLYNRIGPRPLCITAAIVLSAGYFMMTRLHTDTSTGYVVASLALIGVGLGLMIAPVSNMIMNSVARAKQGMISSLTSLERFVPLTLGVAFFNLILIQGVLTIAGNHNVIMSSPAAIRMTVLSAGFDLAFFVSFLLGLVAIVLAFLTHAEVHPDNLGRPGNDEPGMGLI
jgi:EmrB/QacA subfamily drug resistance transporter